MELLWLIPLIPFAGAALNGLLARAPKSVVTLIGVGAPLVSLLLALVALWQFAGRGGQPFEQTLYLWTAGELEIPVGFLLDRLSAVMLFVVTFVGFWIHVYSVGYMGHEAGYRRYFAYLNLFMGSMLLLILGNNYVVMFVGWEGVGLCSYLLIGFYYDQLFPPQAGRKAFIVNRIGDFAFLVGLFALVAQFGTLTYSELFPRAPQELSAAATAAFEAPYALGLTLAGFVALCFFVGAMGKSAQIPLYVWLPDAMAGPTPVSALIHAATMVTAGVYMVARTNAIYQLAPDISYFVAVIGAATALFAATIGIAQNDIKKVLAYSTVSQLGYMFLAAGLGAYSTAVFHLMTHAFFKALLFLGSGSVIHAMAGEQDMLKMGGLKKHLPITYWTFLIGALAIAGIPPFAGFFSKDEILHVAAVEGYWVLYAVGLLTAGITAFYMFRAVFLTFHGNFRGEAVHEPAPIPIDLAAEAEHEPESAHGDHGHGGHGHHHLHESPPVMWVPLVVLALGAVVAGWVELPRVIAHLLGVEPERFHHFLAPVYALIPGREAAEHAMSAAVEWGLIFAAVAVAGAGLLAKRLYDRPDGEATDAAFAARFPAVHRLLVNKYYVDEIYAALIVRPLGALSRFLWKVIDSLVIDGSINAGAALTELTGDLGRFTTTGNVRNYALYFFLGVIALFVWVVL